MRLLLLSNSTAPGRQFLEHAMDAVAAHLVGCRRLLFVPFASADHEGYTASVRRALEPLGMTVTGAHEGAAAQLLDSADAVFVGGGNTFRLARDLHRLGLMTGIREHVVAGMAYLGSSAGTNVAGPSLRTTNDMPIVQPPSFSTVGLIPFQINPHYLDPDPASTYQGETREKRIEEFLEENDVPVLGIREGTWLRVADGACTLDGLPAGGRLFRRGEKAADVAIGEDLSFLLGVEPAFDTAY